MGSGQSAWEAHNRSRTRSRTRTRFHCSKHPVLEGECPHEPWQLPGTARLRTRICYTAKKPHAKRESVVSAGKYLTEEKAIATLYFGSERQLTTATAATVIPAATGISATTSIPAATTSAIAILASA